MPEPTFQTRDGRIVPARIATWRGDEGEPLEASSIPFDPKAIDTSVRSVWRYRALLPLPEDVVPVTLGEGWTPLVDASLVGIPIKAKLEFVQPTGSYKDRGSAVLASMLNHEGVKSAVADSSGNAAASLAASAARINLPIKLFVPGGLAGGVRVRQAMAYGAEVDAQATTRGEAAMRAHAAISGSAIYASHVYSPYFLAGQMTLAWELWEDMGAPHSIVVPVGHGILLLGLHRGFKALMEAGLIESLPRLYGVQSRSCAPVYDAYIRGAEKTFASAPGDTIASSIAVEDPPRGRDVLAAIRESGGTMVSVNDAEIRRGMSLVANLGWYVEPASAAAVAGVVKLDKLLPGDGSVVVPLTGSGLKL